MSEPTSDSVGKPATSSPAPPANTVIHPPSLGETRIELSLLGRYQDPAFGAVGLPALSDDGSQVAYGEEQLDGGRGNPNYRLVVRDAARDRPVVVKDLLSASGRWTPKDEPQVRKRIREANHLLAKRTWRPMTALLLAADDPSAALRGEVDGSGNSSSNKVVIRAGVLEVSHKERVVVRRQLASLLKTDAGCAGAAVLSEAFVLDKRVLVRFHFETDGCIRESEFHVLAY